MASMRRQDQTSRAVRHTSPGRRPKEKLERPSVSRAGLAVERRLRRVERLCRTLRDATEAAEQTQRELLSVLTHDLRNPLSVILVSTRILRRSIAKEEQGAPHLRQVDAIGRAAEEINHIIQDLVDATSIEAGSLQVGCEPTDAAAIVREALDRLEPIAAQKPLRIEREIGPGLSGVLADRDRIVQVIGNLVGNAARFTPKNGTITVRAEVAGGEARFAITDTGPGIDAEQRPHVFTRMRPPGQRVGQGTGLGPYVAKGIVEAHGGRIWIDSAPGRGSTVYFTLPLAEQVTQAEAVG